MDHMRISGTEPSSVVKKFVNIPPNIDNKPTAFPSGEDIKIDTRTA